MLNEIDPATGLPLAVIRLAWFLGLTVLAFAVAVPCLLTAVKRKAGARAEEPTLD